MIKSKRNARNERLREPLVGDEVIWSRSDRFEEIAAEGGLRDLAKPRISKYKHRSGCCSMLISR